MDSYTAGAITWILGNIYIGDLSLIGHGAQFFNPLAKLIGLDGYILMAFILGLPANEIVTSHPLNVLSVHRVHDRF